MTKKKTRRILASTLAVLLLLLTLSVSFVGFAANETGSCGSGLTWMYNDATKTLTISGNGAMNDYSYRSAPWYNHSWEITKIVLEDGITRIGTYAFYECNVFTKIEIPNSVEIIGEAAFRDCTGLVSVKLGNSLKSIGTVAFSSCSVLNRIEIPDNVQSIGVAAFNGCYSLTNVIIGDGVQSISQEAFSNCTNLTNVTFGKSIVSIGSYAFYSCPLTSIILKENLETIGTYAFSSCNLNSVTLPHSLESVGVGAFYWQSGNGNAIAHVYYYGNEADKAEIIIGNENGALLDAQWHYLPIEDHTHSYTSTVTQAATCTETGVRTFTCSCGETYTEVIPVDNSNHVNTKNVAATASTCTAKGYTAGVYCNDCKKYISGHNERPLAAHQTELRNAQEPTCIMAGYTGDYYCTVCKQLIKEGEYIDELGHVDKNTDGKCDRCNLTVNPTPEPKPEPEEENLNFFERILKIIKDFFDRILHMFG
ncbi:MAG: leucine-rich repeat domain-containing protein [Clostridia bacterium]|nr:leucine-rich repeat domain-containing protein [Clostridia bacterium]